MIEILSSLLMVAAITCTPNADGTWTCSGTGIGDIAGVEETPDGYVCTNCVNMTTNECVKLKNELKIQLERVSSEVSHSLAEAGDLLYKIEQQLLLYNDIQYCPYEYITRTDGWGVYYPNNLITTGAYRLVNYNHFVNNILPNWQNTPNYQIVNLNPPSISFKDTPHTYQLTALHNSLVALWKSSYEMGMQAGNDINTINEQVSSVRSGLYHAQEETSVMTYQIDSITCESCKLTLGDSEGDGEGGETGSEAGCLECYLKALADIKDVLDRISSYLYSIEQEITKLRSDMNDKLKSILDKMDDLSESFERLDDYLRIDQSNLLSRITVNVEAFGEITNLFSRYFHSFNATSDSDLKSTLNKVIGADNKFNFEAYQATTNWFTRVEILLAMNAGLHTTNNVEDTEEDFDDKMKDYDDALSSYEQETEQETAEKSITDFVRTWEEIAAAFRFWDNLEEPTEIWLMQSKTLDIGSVKGSLTVNVKSYEAPVVRDVLRHIRVGFRVLWWSLGAFVVFMIGTRLWSTVVDAIKWLIHLLATIFNS